MVFWATKRRIFVELKRESEVYLNFEINYEYCQFLMQTADKLRIFENLNYFTIHNVVEPGQNNL